MKVAIIKSNYTPYGGGEKYATRMIRAFSGTGAEVDVLTATKGQWEEFEGKVRFVTIRQFPYTSLFRLSSFNSSVTQYLKENSYDCILGMDRTEYQTHLRAGGGCHAAWLDRRCRESSSMRCLSFRMNPFHRKMLTLERRAFLSAELKRIICNSRMVQEEIIRYYPDVTADVMVVHNGVEWAEFEGSFQEGLRNRDSIRSRIGLTHESFYFLYVGSGFARKGLRKAITALTELPESAGLLVVGWDKREESYRSHARKLGVSKRVHFFGPHRDVVPYLQAADAFVLPTLYDPFSNASLEALAMGLFTITTAANGCSEVIGEGMGCVLDPDAGVTVANAMKRALESHASRREIRDSVRHLDFDGQLSRIIDVCLEDASSPFRVRASGLPSAS